jgi:glutamate racemase
MTPKKKIIGVMDSGFGGLSVLSELAESTSELDFIYYADLKNSPYGNKSKKEILQLTDEIVQFFVAQNASSVLLACNTATSAAALELRSNYSIPIFGMEPAIKPAVIENPGEEIAVFATKLTLKEEKFNQLEKSLNAGHVLVPIDCNGLAPLIDNEDIPACRDFLSPILHDLSIKNITKFVLGCTHYLLIKPLFYEFNSDIQIYDGNLGTINHILKVLNLSNEKKEEESKIELFINGGTEEDFQIANHYLNTYNRNERNYVK